MFAAQMGHDHIVRILLKNGAHVDAVRCVSFTIILKSTISLKIHHFIEKLFSIKYRMEQHLFSKQHIKDFQQL